MFGKLKITKITNNAKKNLLAIGEIYEGYMVNTGRIAF